MRPTDLVAPWRRLRDDRGSLGSDAAVACAAVALGLAPTSILAAGGRPLPAAAAWAAAAAAEILRLALTTAAPAAAAAALLHALGRPALARRIARSALLASTAWTWVALCPPLLPFVDLLRLALGLVLLRTRPGGGPH